MTTTKPRLAMSAAKRNQLLHEEAERIAVPVYDWIGGPIDGMADALIALGHVHPHLRRHHAPPPADSA